MARVLEHDLKFVPCKADRDVWMREAERQDGSGAKYYEYISTYVDDVIVMSEKPEEIMKVLQSAFKLKPIPGKDVPWEEPQSYLGADVRSMRNYEGKQFFLLGSETYIKNSLKSIQTKLDERGLELNKTAKGPFPSGYRPELDISKFCDPKDANWFQQLIGSRSNSVLTIGSNH